MALRLNGSSSGYVELDVPAAAGSHTLTLPNSGGSSGQYLQTAGDGVLSWQTVTEGKVLQVQSDEYTGTASTTSQDTYGDIDSNFNVSITPATTSSKILVMVTIGRAGVNHNGGRLIPFRVLRGTTDVGVGPVAGNRMQASFTIHTTEQGYSDGTAWTYLDSPNSTSEQTYKVQWADQNGEGSFINRSTGDADSSDTPHARTMCSITVMEISG